ncbi:MAG: glycoside hydrolase family 88 protein, partial [Bifidobacteriaceae bacterium]|nr:glycoside hydrolase family 88 protein [Bifidobacteriaceae bacterium]
MSRSPEPDSRPPDGAQPPERRLIKELVQRLTVNLISITDETGEFLLRLDDGRVIDTKGWAGWEWTHGIGLYGIWQYYSQTGDAWMRQVVDDWFTARLAEGTTKNVNTMAPMLTLAYRYEADHDPTLLPWLEAWAEWAMRTMPRTPHGGMQHITLAEENHHQLWDDTLMMTVLPLTKIGLLLNRPAYVEEATFQFLTHIAYLADRQTGLWFHGWTFDGHHNFAEARWARGNSWLTMVIPDFLELVNWSPAHPVRRLLIEVLQAQVEALAKLQDESGLWHTLLDD